MLLVHSFRYFYNFAVLLITHPYGGPPSYSRSILMNCWIIPSNPDVFDTEGCLAEHHFIFWHQKKKYEVGDIVLIYSSRRDGQIKFVTKVKDVDIPYDSNLMSHEQKYWKTEHEPEGTFMKLQLLQMVESDALARSALMEHGLKGNIQGALKVTEKKLLGYIVDHLNGKVQDYIRSESRFGEFRSWTVLSYNKIVKTCDLSWFKNKGSSVAQETRWFWNADTLEYPDQKVVHFHVEGSLYDARITTDNASGQTRTRIFWNQDCSNLFNQLVDYKDGETEVYMVFEKEGNDTYKATFTYDYKTMAAQEFNIREILRTISATGLIFDPKFVQRYVCSLLTKPFVILSGLTGSGKTQLAMAFPKLICKDKSQYRLVPVGADWTNREPLLGYPNALRPDEYVMPENGALQLILEASKPENADKPYFLILDEMNMSYVERYFADFLSAMESGEVIPLWKGNENVPASIALPKNLFIIGTINVDETTYMFSPKVLDRANVMEFRINKEQMMEYLDNSGTISQPADCSNRAKDFVEVANKEFSMSLSADMKSTLLDIFDILCKIQKEFGYRTAHEMSRYITVVKCYTDMTDDESVDSAIVQKLLPKIHGARKKVAPILKALWAVCYKEAGADLDTLDAIPPSEVFKYPLTAEKAWRMFQIAQDNGFTSFAEA